MNILKELYNGKIYPFETVVPKDAEYYPLSRKIAEARKYLLSKLPQKDKDRLEKYDNMVYETEIMLNYAYFETGYKLGAELIYEGLAAERGRQDRDGSFEGTADIPLDKNLREIIGRMLRGDQNYQEAVRMQREAWKDIEDAGLNDIQRKAVERLAATADCCAEAYGRAAYMQGLKDGAKLSAKPEPPEYSLSPKDAAEGGKRNDECR